MDTMVMIRVMAGVLALVVIGFIVWRRNKQASS
jgi:hypothetical protein